MNSLNCIDIIDVFDGNIPIHTKEYIELFYKYSNLKHYFVILVSSKNKVQEYQVFFSKIGCRQYYIVHDNPGQLPFLLTILLRLRRTQTSLEEKSLLSFLYKNRKKKILFHGNVITPMMVYMFNLYSFRSLNWVCWGTILGKRQSVLKTVAYKKLYGKFRRIVCLMSEDAIEIRKLFKCKCTFVCPYPDKNPLAKKNKTEKSDKTITKVLVGNSGHSLESYIEFCQRLPKDLDGLHFTFMRVYGPVGFNDFKNKILNYIDKKYFDVWDELLSLEQYYKKLNEYDVYVSPQTTQTGLGAIYAMIKLEKTLFLAGYNYSWVSSLGINAQLLEKFIDSVKSKNELKFPIEILTKNNDIYSDIFSNKRRFDKWDNLLTADRNTLNNSDLLTFI